MGGTRPIFRLALDRVTVTFKGQGTKVRFERVAVQFARRMEAREERQWLRLTCRLMVECLWWGS